MFSNNIFEYLNADFNFLGYIYGKARRFIKTFSGRKRYNVLGALNFVTKKVTVVANDTYITVAQVCEMLRKVASEYADKTVHIVLDNARYQKCEIVTTLAQQLGIVLHYIPPYSPNLNLIERLWKHVKSRLRSKYSIFCLKSAFKYSKILLENMNFILTNVGRKYYTTTSSTISRKR